MKTRMIKPGFFENEILAELDPYARLTFIGLWLIADREGRLEDRPRQIKRLLLPCDDCDVDDSLERLALHGFISRYEAEDKKIIQITKWHDHQHVHPREAKSKLPPVPGKGSPKANLGSAIPGACTTTCTTTSTTTIPNPTGDGNEESGREEISKEKSAAAVWGDRAWKGWNRIIAENKTKLEHQRTLSAKTIAALWTFHESYPGYEADVPKALAYAATAAWPDGFIPVFLEFFKPERIREYSTACARKVEASSQIKNVDPNDPEVLRIQAHQAEIERCAVRMERERIAKKAGK